MEVIFGNPFERNKIVYAGVVDEDVELAEFADGSFDNSLRVRELGDIAPDRDRFSTPLL